MAVHRDENIQNPTAVAVSPAGGEFLFFTVQAGGPVPRFQFMSDVKGTLLNQSRFPQDPAELYQWTYLRDPSDIHQMELLSLGLVFAANARYRYVVNVHGPDGMLRPVLDVEYRGGDSTDFETEVFRVVIQ